MLYGMCARITLPPPSPLIMLLKFDEKKIAILRKCIYLESRAILFQISYEKCILIFHDIDFHPRL